jgi:hypothetical protein
MAKSKRGDRLSLLVDWMRGEVVRIEVAMANDEATQDDIEDVLIELQGWLNDADDLLIGRAA